MLAVIRRGGRFARAARRPPGLAVVLAFALLAGGCGAKGEGGAPESSAPSQGNPHEAGLAEKDSRRNGQPDAARTAPSLPGREPRTILGMDAGAVATLFMKPGLECIEPVDKSLLYACTSEDDPKLDLLFEGEVTGSAADQVSGVEVRVYRRGSADFGVASQPFLGLLATHLEYSGADREKAYGFINRALNSKEATIAIGAAEWTMKASHDHKALTIGPTE